MMMLIILIMDHDHDDHYDHDAHDAHYDHNLIRMTYEKVVQALITPIVH